MSDPEGRLLHRSRLAVRWGDMDALGHVNNAAYFRYFEQARIEWYAALGLGALGGTGAGMVIADAHAEFRRPVRYPAVLDVAMGGHSPGRSSFVSTYTIAADGELCTRGSARVVWVDAVSGRPVALPEAVRARLGAVPEAGGV